MVDPDRRINRLTQTHLEFLIECEKEFADRFTERDAEFVEHCSKPLRDPPIVANWFGGYTYQSCGDVVPRHNPRGGGKRGGTHSNTRGGRDFSNIFIRNRIGHQPYYDRAIAGGMLTSRDGCGEYLDQGPSSRGIGRGGYDGGQVQNVLPEAPAAQMEAIGSNRLTHNRYSRGHPKEKQ